jgi:hypothetical protein
MKLLHDNIYIELIEKENKFGIKDDSLSWKAKVMNVGPDVALVDVDDIVYLSKYEGVPYKDGYIVKEHVILGKQDEN